MNVEKFQKQVWDFYNKHGRVLPWRTTITPYRIFISEIMLQQTQVSRVIPKFRHFIKIFPSFKALASASERTLLHAWQGLGYNRRALYIKQAASIISREYGGRVPKDIDTLEQLPGIGPYTARAVLVFAYDMPYPLIETNVRTVLFHHFLFDKESVSDSELECHAEAVLDTAHPREWNWALMDYGASLKQQGFTYTTKSKHYTKQSRFEGSDRQLRGHILRHVLESGYVPYDILVARIDFPKWKVEKQLTALKQEGFITIKNGIVRIVQ